MLPRCFVLCTLLFASSLDGAAQSPPALSRFGNNLSVPLGQTIGQATCFLCSARVDGTVTGGIRVFAGNVSLSGKVGGNVLVFGGNVSLSENAVIEGGVLIFGGHLNAGSATIKHAPHVISPLIFLPAILIICLVIGGLIVLTRRTVRGPTSYPPLPRL